MNYDKKLGWICYSVNELKQIVGNEMKKVLLAEIKEKQLDLAEVGKDRQLMEQFVGEIVLKNNKRKEFIELFYSTTLADSIYKSEKTSVCFEVKRGVRQQDIDAVNDYESLLKILEENTEMDFSVVKEDGVRKFQLKQYKGELETESLAQFITEKVEEYVNLGAVNLLVILQGKDNNGSQIVNSSIDYHRVAEIVGNADFQSKAEVLIARNDRNINNSIVQVYPNVSEYKIPLVMPSKTWQ